MMTIRDRLEYLRGEIEAERISYSEIAELQGLAKYIDPSDTVLLEWAGVPEFPEDEDDDCRIGAIAVIDAHVPSLTDEDEAAIDNNIGRGRRIGYDIEDMAELAIRTCACGKRIDGFYEYADHLKDELRKAATAEDEKCVRCGIRMHLCQLCLDRARRRW